MTLLRLQIDLFLTVKKDGSIQFNVSFIRCHHTGNTTKGHTFSAAGFSQDSQHFLICFKFRIQNKASEILFYFYIKSHFVRSYPADLFPAVFFFSSIFTARSTTAEIAIFTITHLNASKSSLVRHN